MTGFEWWLKNKTDYDDVDDESEDVSGYLLLVARYRQERADLWTKVCSGEPIDFADFKDCRGFGIATFLARQINTQSLLFEEVIRLHARKKIRAPQAVALLEAGSARRIDEKSLRTFGIARLLEHSVVGNPYAGGLVLVGQQVVTQVWPMQAQPGTP